MKYAGAPLPKVHLSQRILREPDVSKQHMLVQLPEAKRMNTLIINMEYATGADKRMVQVFE